MRKILMLMVLGLIFQGAASAETYVVDTEGSSVGWHATKVTGAHNGSIMVLSGQVEIEEGVLVGGEAVIDMTSITVEDIKNPEYNQKLVNHLKNEDFFNVAEHPEATILLTDISDLGGGTYDVAADITIKGITNPVEFQAVVIEDEGSLEATAEIVIDRTDFDVRYGSGKFFEDLGDKMIHDEFKLTVTIFADK